MSSNRERLVDKDTSELGFLWPHDQNSRWPEITAEKFTPTESSNSWVKSSSLGMTRALGLNAEYLPANEGNQITLTGELL